ncbi:DUF4132 domain-containing protein [Actinomadura kijaniata]|uniref:DUF4132 domain-containing protein n=1 Tax=Actinomadura kijaniata TaxID=46161 RepID=UPI003F1C99C4
MTPPFPSRVKDAPGSALPSLLVNPPWTRPGTEPVVLELAVPQEPVTTVWAPGEQEEWLKEFHAGRRFEPLPDDTDWDEVAGTFASGEALSLGDDRLLEQATGLLMQAPPEYGERLLVDERYWKALSTFAGNRVLRGAVARHGGAAWPAVPHLMGRRGFPELPLPFFGSEVARTMIGRFGDRAPGEEEIPAKAWFCRHGREAARLTVPHALGGPGPLRQHAEEALRFVIRVRGEETVVEAARPYGEEAVAAVGALNPHSGPPPEVPGWADTGRLPRVLLRGGRLALPATATRNLLAMVGASTVREPYPGLKQVAELLDPASLAELAWALYTAERDARRWASDGVRYALLSWGDDRTADRLAPVVEAWNKSYVRDRDGRSALDLFARLGTDGALRHLHRISTRARDRERIRRHAGHLLGRIAGERGLTVERLIDRLVPGFGLDPDGTMVLDYGPRRFTVGFDERLMPYVVDGAGKHRRTLPKPGVRDDDTLAPAAHQRFAALRKEVRTATAEQLARLEDAMITGRTWTAGEFRDVFVAHPLLRHVVRRLVWSATVDGRAVTFRVAEDRTLAGVDDAALTLPGDAPVSLPHPITLGEEALRAWRQIFADYEIGQPFLQLARPVHTLPEEERGLAELARFEGRTTDFGRVLALTRRGWELRGKEYSGFRRQVTRTAGPHGRHVMVFLDPGIRVSAPGDHAEQRTVRVTLWTGLGSGVLHPFSELGPVVLSEILTDLTSLFEPAADPGAAS